MANDQTREENDRIDVNDEEQCVRWSHELNVDLGELKAAVDNAGPRAEDVRRYIRERTLPPLGREQPLEGTKAK